MTYAAVTPGYRARAVRRRGLRGPSPQAILFATTLGISAGIAGWVVGGARAPMTQNIVVVPAAGPVLAAAPAVHPVVAVARAAAAPSPELAALFTSQTVSGGTPSSFAQSRPVASTFAWTAPQAPEVLAEAAPVPVAMPASSDVPLPPPAPQQIAAADDDDAADEAQTAAVPAADFPPLPPPSPLLQNVPLPTPRPAELQAPGSGAPYRRPPMQMAQRSRGADVAADRPDGRNILERLFSPKPQPGSALAYAAPEDDAFGPQGGVFGGSYVDGGTAVYDIAAHTVTLPDGTRLEAHSGLGARIDDPRYVADRNRGPTPPHLYDLTMRESLFHGVQALRLNPVGGGGVYGRAGLLAHTFMLGPRGDSNGCVSFRNYNAFLAAYRRGEIRRLMVVASR